MKDKVCKYMNEVCVFTLQALAFLAGTASVCTFLFVVYKTCALDVDLYFLIKATASYFLQVTILCGSLTIAEYLEGKKTDREDRPSCAPADYIPGQPIGIPNAGNTCFINATFQVLLNEPIFKRALLQKIEKDMAECRKLNLLTFAIYHKTEILLNEATIRDLLIFFKNKCRILSLKNTFSDFLKEQVPSLFKSPREFALDAEASNKIKNHMESKSFRKIYRTIYEEAKERYSLLQKLSSFIEAYDAQGAAEKTELDSVHLRFIRQLFFDKESHSQEDACEVLDRVLNFLNIDEQINFEIDVLKGYKEVDSRSYSSSEKEILKSKNCQSSTVLTGGKNFKESMTQSVLRLELPKGKVHGQEALDRYFTAQQIASNDRCTFVKTEKDGDGVEHQALAYFEQVEETISLKKMPQILPIQWKRFSSDASGRLEKNNADIEMPDDLTLAGEKYTLSSFIFHTGSLHSGHYIAFIKKDGKWWSCDDRWVTQISAEKAAQKKNKSYMYFYNKA